MVKIPEKPKVNLQKSVPRHDPRITLHYPGHNVACKSRARMSKQYHDNRDCL